MLDHLAHGWWIFAPGAALPLEPQTHHDASEAHYEAQFAAQQQPTRQHVLIPKKHRNRRLYHQVAQQFVPIRYYT
jgi:hypothetical protein